MEIFPALNPNGEKWVLNCLVFHSDLGPPHKKCFHPTNHFIHDS